MQNYNLLIEKIAGLSGLQKEEIERRIEAKKAKLSGLISKEGAAQIVAAELNINFENESLKIAELTPGMRKLNCVVKIINIFPVRTFNKNGKEGKVANIIGADETGSIRIVLWDTNHISLIEKANISINDVIEIKNASMRDSEIHLSGFSEIKKSSVSLENVKTERTFNEKNIKEIIENQPVKIRGIVVQIYPPRFFVVCPECNKKLIQMEDGPICKDHGKVEPKERALITLVVDDGTETIKVVLFQDQIEKLSKESLKEIEKLAELREKVIGSEFYITGTARKNQLFNSIELIVSDIEEVKLEELIEKLEKIQ